MTALGAARVAPEKAVLRPALPLLSWPGWIGTNVGKMSYAEQLKHPNWQRKRLEVLGAAEFRCEMCGDSESTLHVHHKQYIKGRMAWEYDAQELAAMCESCHEVAHSRMERRASFLARLDFDGPCSADDFFARGAGAMSGWVSDPKLIEEIGELCRLSPYQFDCGRVGGGIGRLRISAIALGRLADLLDGDPIEKRDAFVSGLFKLMEDVGINPHPVPFKG